jgi:hypothetical protein
MEYEKYLIANNLVPNGRAGYYVNWVDKFLHGINYREEGVNQSSLLIGVLIFVCAYGNQG